MFHRAENLDPDSALILAQLSAAYSFRFRSRHTTASREEAERYIAKAHMLDPDLPELVRRGALVRLSGAVFRCRYRPACTRCASHESLPGIDSARVTKGLFAAVSAIGEVP